ncbi:MAG: hypothetical protein WBO10_00790 [Pyrinomonadaceae bacterium]
MKNLLASILFSLVFFGSAYAQTGEVKFSRSPTTADGSLDFKSGEYVFAHIKTAQPIASMLTLNERPVTFLVEFSSKGNLLEEEMYGFDTAKVRGAKQAEFVLPVISDPAGDVPLFGKNLFAIRLPGALGKLSAGSHEIEFDLKSYNYKDAGESIAKDKFTLTIGADAKAFYAKNEKDSYDAMTQRGVSTVTASARDVAMGVVGGTSVITLVNNCGRSVWLRKALGSDKAEYRLSAGQTMKYDRDSGYLEEWNFGTKKWATVSKVWSADSTGKANICTK